MLLRSWLSALPGPVAVAYEAGPTGFGLYRYLTAAGSAARWRSRRSCRSRQGQSRVQEAITKTGNGHARRLLRPPGTTAPATPRARPCGTVGSSPQQPRGSVATTATGGSISAG